ncbi:ThiF family adenylyltransferase [Edaphobacter albus]|uniref:ThiF family adenylyltransferase n=1 Tax=Edaphobacter sp. 4G125 TaxID=2763071 RepID=UPI0016467E5E|nr:ThiF family adenylyltransferase [Edaphobacter sp. 4G125]QNI38044.1 ThiF family adenylyltransferase [Edaphobacter sp. 4G125]
MHPLTPDSVFPRPVTSAPFAIDDQERYSRQILFPGIGLEGQRKLAQAHVSIVGCGATGAATASLLARAGIGTLTLIDRDFVEPSNLQRQVLFDEEDALQALPKAEAARRKIALFNSNVRVHAHIADLVPGNIDELLRDSQIILDATDNFETRYLINDFSVREGKPWIYAAAIGAYAATMNILPREETKNLPWEPTACLACIFPKPPSGPVETCDTSGILATAVNFAASIQVTEAFKFLTGQAHHMRRTMLSFDLWSSEQSEITTARPRKECTVCGHREFTHLAGTDRPHITLCGRNSVQIHEHHRPVDFAAMRDRLTPHGAVRFNDLLLRFERGPHTLTLFADGRAIVQGTTDITVARSLYARFIGS